MSISLSVGHRQGTTRMVLTMVNIVKNRKQKYVYKSIRTLGKKHPGKIYLGNVKNMPVVIDSSNIYDDLGDELSGFLKLLKDGGIDPLLAEIVKESTHCYIQHASEVLFSPGMTDRKAIIQGFYEYISVIGLDPDLVERFKEWEARYRKAHDRKVPACLLPGDFRVK